MKRREFLWAAAGVCASPLGVSLWRNAFAAPATPGPSPYGAISPTPDVNGLRLPAGFSAKVIAVTGAPVSPTRHIWHLAPDGGACFSHPDSGWIYTSNSEVPFVGGAAMIRFDPTGAVVDARSILSQTHLNCAGGPTPWGTWLSCEEWEFGHVWECYLDGRGAEQRPDLGTFAHEAVAVDPARRRLYMTEDESDGRFYRYIPDAWPELAGGKLYAANVSWANAARTSGAVQWRRVPDDVSARHWPMSTYTTAFNGGEGCWHDAGLIYFASKGDNRIWSYDAGTNRIEVLYDAALYPDAPLRGVDNIVVSRFGDIYVAEDGGDMQLCIITPDGVVAAFLELEGHEGSEITGPAFSPAGDRLYFNSQRGPNNRGLGMTFEVRGPFRGA